MNLMRISAWQVFVIAAALMSSHVRALAEERLPTCREWHSKVDAQVNPEAAFNPLELSEGAKLAGAKCLLQLKSNRSKARFSGAARFDTSQVLPSATVEIGALYYVSYIFLGKWDHAGGVALRGRNGRVNDPRDVELACTGYQKWFKSASKIGWEAARREGLSPLSTGDIHWY
jgi:hypothetical protein